MSIDDFIYPLLVDSFPGEDAEEVQEILEDLKGSRGIDNSSELEQEIWWQYLFLKRRSHVAPAPRR